MKERMLLSAHFCTVDGHAELDSTMAAVSTFINTALSSRQGVEVLGTGFMLPSC